MLYTVLMEVFFLNVLKCTLPALISTAVTEDVL